MNNDMNSDAPPNNCRPRPVIRLLDWTYRLSDVKELLARDLTLLPVGKNRKGDHSARSRLV